MNIDDKCETCDGKGTWEVPWDEVDDATKAMLGGIDDLISKFPGSKLGPLVYNCPDCQQTGSQAVREQWSINRLDPKKHEYVFQCTDGDPCWEYKAEKKEHLK